ADAGQQVGHAGGGAEGARQAGGAAAAAVALLWRRAHYLEHVKKMLVERFGRLQAVKDPSFGSLSPEAQDARATELGEEYVTTRGLIIYIGMDARMQAAAHTAVRAGLETWSKARGWAGPSLRIEVDKLAAAKKALHAGFDKRVDKLTGFAGMKN